MCSNSCSSDSRGCSSAFAAAMELVEFIQRQLEVPWRPFATITKLVAFTVASMQVVARVNSDYYLGPLSYIVDSKEGESFVGP